jgi:two-component system CheB/CheR fusion protein
LIDEKYVSLISHELKNPLAVISSQIELLEQECLDKNEESKKTKIEILKRNIKKANYIINELNNLALINTGKIELYAKKIPIHEIVNDLKTGCHEFARQKNIKLNFVFEDLDIVVDFVKLSQTLTNLILNAIHFSPRDKVVDIFFIKEDGFLKIEVKDKGEGISRENHENIFYPFFQEPNNNRKKGLGLGLFVARKMAELHGGRIDLYSEKGYGATFVVMIPLNIEEVQDDGN